MWKFLLITVICITWAISESYQQIDEDLTLTKSNGCNSTKDGKIHVTGSFDLNIHNATTCYWNVTVDKSKNITGPISLFFMYLFIHPDDQVNVYGSYEDAVNDTNPLISNLHPQDGTVTVITERTNVTIKYQGTADFVRKLEVVYNHDCSFPVAPDVEVIHSPIYASGVQELMDSDVECTYRFNEIQHERVKQVLTFEEFNITSSKINFEGSSLNGEYKNDNPEDVFIDLNTKKPMELQATMHYNTSDYFKVKVHLVDKSCSGKIEKSDDLPVLLKSPSQELNNGSIIAECRFLIKHTTQSRILGLKLGKLNFISVFDIIAVNDGLSEISTPLLQVTTSNQNVTRNQLIRSTGNYLWISFKPLSYASSFTANVTVHGQGGYLKNNGKITMASTSGDDTIFQLEVDEGKNVILNFIESSFAFPATLSIYDGFDTNNLLTSLHGHIKYPVVSKTSKMMIVATHFDAPNTFSANFTGIDSGCMYMSTLSSESYFLSEKCNSSCQWIIPPQDTTNSILLLALQYISLKEGDSLEIYRLDDQMTQLGLITANQTHVPRLSLPANVGALVKIVQAPCKQEDKIVLLGHSSYMPACNYTINPKESSEFQISSPLYPDTYPLFSNCYWAITALESQFLHIAFQELKLAENHCVRVIQKSSKTNITYVGTSLPDDLFLNKDVNIEFDSSNCDKKEVGQKLVNSVGFVVNITVADCGQILSKTSGDFNTSIDKNKKICMWKVVVPPTDKDSVNIISFSVAKKDEFKNYEFQIYDGSSVRDNLIAYNLSSEFWSRTNVLIFTYKRLNVTNPSSVLAVKYSTISCNKTMQCDNKLCMHPNWRCNNINDCGDYSDERNCETVPVSPDVPPNGYSGLVLGICIVLVLFAGLGAGLCLPKLVEKYRESRYTRFRELSGIDG